MNEPKELEVLTKQERDLTTFATSIVVSNEQELKGAGLFLVSVKELIGQVKDTFKEPKAAATKAHKAVCTAEKTHLEPLEKVEAVVKDKVRIYLTEKAAADKHAQDEAKLAMATTLESAGHLEMADAVMSAPTQVEKPVVAGMSTSKHFTFDVVNPEAVPNVYRALDLVAIGKVVRALGFKANIPGIYVREEVTVSVKRAS